MKLDDIITSNNMAFIHKTLKGDSPKHFDTFFKKFKTTHNYSTNRNCNSTYSIPPGSISIPNSAKDSLRNKCAKDWNRLLKVFTNPAQSLEWLLNMNDFKLKSILKDHFFSTY